MRYRFLIWCTLSFNAFTVSGQDVETIQLFEDKKNSAKDCVISDSRYDFEAINETKIKEDFERMLSDLKIEKDPFSDYQLRFTADTSTRDYEEALGLKVLSLMNANNENIAKPNQLVHLSGFRSSSNLSINDRSIYEIEIKEPTNDLIELKAQAYLTYQPSSKKTVFAKSDVGKTKTYRGVKYKLKYFNDAIILFDYFSQIKDFDYQTLSNDDFIIPCNDYFITSGKRKVYEALKEVYGIDNIPLGEESGAMVIFTSPSAQKIVFEESVNKKVLQREVSIKMPQK